MPSAILWKILAMGEKKNFQLGKVELIFWVFWYQPWKFLSGKFSAVLLSFCQAYIELFSFNPQNKRFGVFWWKGKVEQQWILWSNWDLAREDREEIKAPLFSPFSIPSFSKHLPPWLSRPTGSLTFSPTSPVLFLWSSQALLFPSLECRRAPGSGPDVSSLHMQ